LKTGELGHYDPTNFSICLYDIENKPDVLDSLKRRIKKITPGFKSIVLSPKEKYTYINILDIEL
jgi:hypothetical protein